MGGCSALNCSSHSRNKIKMHRFPVDPERRLKWTLKCGRTSWVPNEYAELCHLHFEESQYEQHRSDKLRKLKPNAVPTLFDVPNPPSCNVIQDPSQPLLQRIALLEEENRTLKLENMELISEISKLKLEIQQKNTSLSFLSEEQIHAASKEQSKPLWSNEGIVKGLKFRFALGKFGYEFLRSTGYPAPAYSTLNRRIEDIKVPFGVLHDILSVLKSKVEVMEPADKLCGISIDEMEIGSTQDFDTSSGSFVGNVTLGSQQDVGNHYTVVLLRGLKSPWKQVVAHEITGASCSESEMKELLCSTIEAVRGIGLTVKASTSDMGTNNIRLWRSLGVSVGKSERNTIYSVGEDTEVIHSVADVPHLLKNMRSAFLTRPLTVPEDVCLNQSLPSKFVNGKYVKDLWELEINSHTSLRSLHHLNREHLYPSQLQKMNVGSAVRLFSVHTAAALEKAAHLQQIPKESLTTAWFIRLMHEWFSLMSARHPMKGITEQNQAEKFQFLEDFIYIMQHIKLGLCWKPLQTGMIMSSLSVINVSKEMFSAGCNFFLPGRLSQDALENVFSQIRRKSASKPTALQAKRSLKMICISQFMSNLKDTNYFADSDSHLFDFVNSTNLSEINHNTSPLSAPVAHNSNLLSAPVATTAAEENDIFYIASATLNAVLKLKICSICKDALMESLDSENPEVPSHRMLLNKYCNMGGLKEATSGIYRICREAEKHLQINKENVIKSETPIDEIFISEIIGNCSSVILPMCCNLKYKIISHYLVVRCKGIKNHLYNKRKVEASYASSSVAKKNKILT